LDSSTNSLPVKFPEDLLIGKTIEDIIFSPRYVRIGVVVLSGKLKNKRLLRLYQIVRLEGWDCFVPTHEIGAFTFHNKMALKDFVERLPEMSSLEILMIINPHPNN
jgi:hypothetical protein